MGTMTAAQGLISFGLIALTAFILIMIAGKVYTMTAFYHGKVPSPKDLFKMLRSGGVKD